LRLLFDANLSPKLTARLADLFPDSTHVFDTGLAQFTSDGTIWEYALANRYVIVTTDADFLGLTKRHGAPPKVVRLERCDYKTAVIEDLIRRNAVRIYEFGRSKRAVLLIRKKA